MSPNLSATAKLGPVDIVGQLAVNYMATGQATNSPDLRWCWGNPQVSSPWRDYRFGAGIAAAGLGTMADGDSRRFLFDLASGSLNSFIATERVRKAALERTQGPQAGAYQQPQGYQQPGGYQQVPGPQPVPQFGPPVYTPPPAQFAPSPQAQVSWMPGMFR